MTGRLWLVLFEVRPVRHVHIQVGVAPVSMADWDVDWAGLAGARGGGHFASVSPLAER